MIAFGADYGGPELQDSHISQLLMRAGQIAIKARSANYNNGEETWINPIFIVPGSVSKPDFTDYKIGHFF